MNYHQYTKTQLENELQTSLETGLTETEARARLLKMGPNVLPEQPQDGWVKIFFRQFQSPLIYILLISAALVYLMGDLTDAAIIMAVLTCNAVIGAIQEGKSGRVLQSLKKLSQSDAAVIRGGVEMVVLETEVVKGDLLALIEGQRVPADARIVFGYNLSADEASLTGESGAVPKKEGVISEEDVPVANRHNMVFKGTAILSGEGRAVVVETGKDTELGKISQALLGPEEEIPLQKNIKALSRVIIYITAGLCVALFALGLLQGKPLRETFSLVVALSVSVIPEGLPLVLTVILATGVWRMSRRNALVKKLQAVEALGQAKVLAVDKTGTVTKNQMVIKQLYAGGRIYSVSGDGYEPIGGVSLGGEPQNSHPDVAWAAKIAGLVAKATVFYDETSGLYKISGDPTEAAMAVLGEKLGCSKGVLREHYKELAEIPFDYKNKYRAVFYGYEDRVLCVAAGAPEVILHKSINFLENGQSREISKKQHLHFEDVIEDFSAKGLRLVAFGYKYLPKSHALDNIDNLVLGGFFGIEDAVRPEAKAAVKAAEAAGVRVVMITGDHRATARAIAREVDIYHEGDLIITGSELAEMNERQLAEKLERVTVFARVTPSDKMKIIKAYKHLGQVIAMTGDGVNDAPSLVAADLGVAMGKIGTEVAKEASDIVLLDDDLSSIVAAIEEGRVMHQNIKKSLQFLFSTSLGELMVVATAMVLGLPLPLLAVQILWMNLVTDPLIGASLAMEKREHELMKGSHPRFNKYFVDFPMFLHIIMVVLLMTVGGLFLFRLYSPLGIVKAQTMALTLLSVFQWYNGLNCRFLGKSILHKRIFRNRYMWLSILANVLLQSLAVYNPWFNRLLHTTSLSFQEWAIVLGLGLSVVAGDELRKLVLRAWEYRILLMKRVGKQQTAAAKA